MLGLYMLSELPIFILYFLIALPWLLSIRFMLIPGSISVFAGIFAGYISFSIYAMWFPALDLSIYNGLSFLFLLLGAVSGFMLLAILRYSFSIQLMSFINFFITTSSTIALFNLSKPDNEYVVSFVTLGVALGMLVHIMLIPSTITEIFNEI